MRTRIFFWSITSALAGFLFGFDTVVISGAEQKIQSLWGLSAGIHGVAMGSALYGTVLGSLLGGWPTDRFGRKATLLCIGVLYLCRPWAARLPTSVAMFIAARFIGGLGIGISTVVAPLYISEIAPPAYRGRLAGMFQFNIVFGILIAFLSNCPARGHRRERLALDAGRRRLPFLVYTVMCFGLPESPRWLLGRKGDREAGARGAAADRTGSAEPTNRGRGGRDHGRLLRTVSGRAFLDLAAARARSCWRSSSPSSTSFPASTPSCISRRAFLR